MEPNIEIKHDGAYGWNYTVSLGGVLVAKGWVRCLLYLEAMQLVRVLLAKREEINSP